jgi:ABC-type multidrug transport system ATPase subunit
LSRITEPTTGRVELNGRVASLLEVGTGFHPELTGRENIFLNGAILGMSRAEIRRKFDEIVDFSGVEQFLDTPVKRYSSGMYVRLAFAVAAHLEPEILVVDEVLAVGDAEFQKKCLGKMEEVSTKEGRTVLFVSHNIGVISQICNEGIFINSGKIITKGKVLDCIKSYNSEITSLDITILKNSYFKVLNINVIDLISNNSVLITGNALKAEISVQYLHSQKLDDFSFRVKIFNLENKEELFCYDSWKSNVSCKLEMGDTVNIDLIIKYIPFSKGTFQIAIWGHSFNSDIWEEILLKKIDVLENKNNDFSHIDKNTLLQLQTNASISKK